MNPEQHDHDLLIEINTTLKRVVEDIKELRDGTTVKIADHDKRIDQLEKDFASHKLANKITYSIYATIGGALAYLFFTHLMK